MDGNASLIDQRQFHIKEDLANAIYLHYGYKWNGSDWVAPANSEKLVPEFSGDLIARPIYLYHRVNPGAVSTFKLFDQTKGGKGIHITNQEELNCPQNKIRVFSGLKLRYKSTIAKAGTDPTAAEMAAIAWGSLSGAPANGRFAQFDVSQKKVLIPNTPIGLPFDNTDRISNYARFPQLVVQEPGEKIEVQCDFDAALAATDWFDFALAGWELSVKPTA